MSEVELRLRDMDEAKEHFRRSAVSIDLSVDQIRQLITPMLPFIDAGLVAQYRLHIGQMEELTLLLREFTEKLGQASHDVQGALLSMDDLARNVSLRSASSSVTPYTGAVLTGFEGARPLSEGASDSVEVADAPVDINAFVSDNNRTLYQQLLHDQDTLLAEEQRLDQLTHSRDLLQEDLSALRNRMSSFNSNISLDNVPRVQSLEDQITLLNQEISDTQVNIAHLEINISESTERLAMVAPTTEADLAVIADLQDRETAPIVVDNTYGCVNHVVTRMPIPMELARDAHLWDEMAERYTEYGVRMGDVPLEGAVIVMETEHSYADDINGHLMYIERVDADGGVWITDNFHPETPVLLSDLTDETDGEFIHYMYLPWHTKG